MNGSKTLLDTNIIIGLFRGNKQIEFEFKKVERPAIPFAVLGELYAGAFFSSQQEKNLALIQSLRNQCEIIFPGDVTTQIFGRIRSDLQRKGKPIPENDIWIAALAQQNQLTLVTNDSHFKEVENLHLQTW